MSELKSVLAATDGSEHGMSAVATGAACAHRAGASFQVVSVVEVLLLPTVEGPAGEGAPDFESGVLESARRTAEAQAREAGAPDATIHVRGGLAAPLIKKVAAETEADLIVVGAHPQPAVARFLVGSTAERTIRLADRPVLAAVEARREPFRRVLAAIDLSDQSRSVLESAATIARMDQAELRALYVQEPLFPMLAEAALLNEEELRRHSREQFERSLEEADLPADVSVDGRMREGHSGREILEEAQDWDADLVVVGSHGFGFFDRLLLGSTSLYVLRHGQRATMVVPRPER